MSKSQAFHCGVHDLDVPNEDGEGCPRCIEFFANPPDVNRMTGEARAAELKMWFANVLSVRFEILHERIEALVGRPVWTHEMGLNSDGLIAEAGGQIPHLSAGEIISDFARWCEENGKPLIAIGV